MSDYISREELSDNLCYGISCNECSFNTTSDGQSGCLLQERIDNLPSADVRENIHGEWIRITHGIEVFHKCSVCGEESDYVLPKRNFCPNCGADMSGIYPR